MPFRGFDRPGDRERSYPHQIYTDEYTRALYIEDPNHPYTTPPDQPYTWVRSRCVGGKILHWSRNARRLSDYDFKAADRDGYGENWPITYADLAPYYDKLESFIGVAGSMENIPHLPDGNYLPPFPLNCGERIVQKVAPTVGLGMRVILNAQLSVRGASMAWLPAITAAVVDAVVTRGLFGTRFPTRSRPPEDGTPDASE
jgi:choline dehydrogenase-like flavoprotein